MKELEGILKDLNFSQYESQVLITLIRYNLLDAKGAYENSGVPQPKIYETMIRLQEKGLIDILSKGRKKVYKIKPKEVIQEYILEFNRRTKKGIDIIEDIYNTGETEEIPFIGIAGLTNIQEYLYTIIDTAKESLISFLPPLHYDSRIITILKEKKDKLDIKIIFDNEDVFLNVKETLKDFEIYCLKEPAFEKIGTILTSIERFVKKDSQEPTYALDLLKTIGSNLPITFGLAVVDYKKSFFRIPLPVDIPLALLSTLPQLVNFHNEGIKAILSVSKRI